MLPERGLPSPSRPPVSVLQQRDSAGQPLQSGRRQPLSTPWRRWGASGGGAGRPGRLPGGGGWQRREACEPPEPPGPTASPRSRAISRAFPGRDPSETEGAREGGGGASPPLAGRLLWDPAGLPGRSVTTPGRGHSEGSWLPAASMLGAGSDLWSPKWSLL